MTECNETQLNRSVQDYVISVQLETPRGLFITISAGDIPTKAVRKMIDNGDDNGAAILMFNLTGLPCTIRRIIKTTCRTG